MKSSQLKILFIAKFKNDKNSFPVTITTEESGKDQPELNSIAKVIGRAIAAIDRSQAKRPGDFIRMVQDEIDNSFKDCQLNIETRKTPKPRSIIEWMLPKKS